MNRLFTLILAILVQALPVAAQGLHMGDPVTPMARESMSGGGLSVPEDANWDDRFGPVGTDGEVTAVAVSGEDIYVAGQFHRAGGVPNLGLARWNTRVHKWYRIGADSEMINGVVAAMAVVGGKIYVGGQFTTIGTLNVRNLAMFDIASETWLKWTDGAGGGVHGGSISTIVPVGHDLYVGGQFTAIGTILANNIARWDGTEFKRVGGGVSDAVSVIFNSGTDLYVGGKFLTAGSVPAAHVARWDGKEWSAIGSGTNGPVRAVAVDGGYIYVGGTFDSAGGMFVRNLARCDRATGEWSNMGGGVRQIVPDPRLPPSVNAIQPVDGKIFVAGIFTLAGEVDKVGAVAVWDGSRIRGLRRDTSDVYSHGIGGAGIRVDVMVLAGGDLYLGGMFDTAYGKVALSYTYNPLAAPVYANNIVRWSLSDREWHPVGTSPDNALLDLLVDGDDVYFSGNFHTIGGIPAGKVARWNSRTAEWSDAGAGLDSAPGGMASYGGRLYAARRNYLYLRDKGSGTWEKLGDSLPGQRGFAVAVGASGIYAGNETGVYRLGSPGWTLIDTIGLHLPKYPASVVPQARVLTLMLDGDRLYAGGNFSIIGSVPARNIARFDLKSGRWSSLGDHGPGNGPNDEIRDLKSDQGRIFAAGNFIFDSAGELRYNNIAEWNETDEEWSPLGQGMSDPVNSLDVRESRLYAAGEFTAAGDVSASRVAMWDGEIWSPLGSGLDGTADGIAAGANQVIVIGTFDYAGWKPSFRIGRWSDQSLSVPVTGLAENRSNGMEIIPNPCSTVVSVRFDRPASSAPARLLLYNALGHVVIGPLEGELSAGRQSIPIDVSGLASGVYYCKLQQGDYIAAQPIVVTR